MGRVRGRTANATRHKKRLTSEHPPGHTPGLASGFLFRGGHPSALSQVPALVLVLLLAQAPVPQCVAQQQPMLPCTAPDFIYPSPPPPFSPPSPRPPPFSPPLPPPTPKVLLRPPTPKTRPGAPRTAPRGVPPVAHFAPAPGDSSTGRRVTAQPPRAPAVAPRGAGTGAGARAPAQPKAQAPLRAPLRLPPSPPKLAGTSRGVPRADSPRGAVVAEGPADVSLGQASPPTKGGAPLRSLWRGLAAAVASVLALGMIL